MARSDGFKQRYFDATIEYARVHRKTLVPTELAKAVSHKLERSKEYSASSVSRWKNGVMPDVPTIAAIAEFLGVDPGWLAFGSQSAAPAPGTVASTPTAEDLVSRRDLAADSAREEDRRQG